MFEPLQLSLFLLVQLATVCLPWLGRYVFLSSAFFRLSVSFHYCFPCFLQFYLSFQSFWPGFHIHAVVVAVVQSDCQFLGLVCFSAISFCLLEVVWIKGLGLVSAYPATHCCCQFLSARNSRKRIY